MPRKAEPQPGNVYWIGGSACGGKSSTAAELARRHGLEIYSCDRAFDRHRERVDPGLHPFFHGIMNKGPRELWKPPPGEQRDELIGFYREQLPMVLDDLRARSAGGPLLVEGAGLLPAELAPAIAPPERFVLLIPTPEFRATLTPRNATEVRELLESTDDADRAYDNWMGRDVLYGRWLRAEAAAAGVPVIDNDGTRTIAEQADRVEGLFRLVG